ncbi:MAG: Lon-like protease with PDZ domain [uncultured Nocardioidaceae bacterium]|uniref:endopeptidase La n=1 Tax=uncultured Nocardioidaceae bacterium TaxID=253824 RepID=A0A6J4M0I3_9ACTN|nr:MAG: Lon-like protease with PDZ domain [uncultured Nocardioidaceae bacterium]
MSRRTVSSIIAVVALVALFGVAAMLPVPYVTMSPGPTLDVLAERQGEEIVQIDGERSYPTKGTLELTTISVTSPERELGLAEVLGAWFDKTRAVYPRDAIYLPEQTAEDVEAEGDVEMISSQDTAIAAALSELGYDLGMSTEVFDVTEDGPADGKLKARDRIISVDGAKVRDADAVVEAVQQAGVGGTLRFEVLRAGERRTVSLRPAPGEDDPDQARVGVTVGGGYDFPFAVEVNIDDSIGGPSAGLIFALAVYDSLTPGALTGGRHIAGTGTITADGTVGPIGGIQQKIVAAADTGGDLFLVPADNCDSALEAAVEEDEIELVKAATLRSAVRSIRAFADDPDAELPRCG